MTRAIGVLLLLPFAAFAAQAFLGEGGFAFRAAAWATTLQVALPATLLALVLGAPAAAVLACGARSWTVALAMIPMLLPPVLPATAWAGGGSVIACALILGCVSWPIVALVTWASLTRLPRAQLEAADLGLDARRTFTAVVWPHVRVAVLASAAVVFLLAACEFTVPSVFALRTVSTVIYEDVSAFRFASAAWTALPLAVFAVAVAIPLRRALVLPQSGPSRPILRGRPAAIARGVAVAAWLLMIGILLFSFLPTVGSPSAFLGAVSLHASAFGWSAGIGLATATLLVAWASLTPRRSALEPLWLAGLVLPGIIPALGVLTLANRAGLQPFFSPVGLLLVWALMARFAYVAWLPLREPVERAQVEAAELAGMSRGRAWRKIVLPALWPKALAVGAVVFALSLGEVGPSVLLAPPGGQTVVQHVFTLVHYGYDETVASLALALMVGVALLAGLGLHAGRRNRPAVAA